MPRVAGEVAPDWGYYAANLRCGCRTVASHSATSPSLAPAGEAGRSAATVACLYWLANHALASGSSLSNGCPVMEVTYRAIGIIHSPFSDLKEMPIQPTGTASAPGTAEVFPEFVEGLKDLEGFSHVILLYHLHEVRRTDLTVMPFLGSETRGVFATRAPTRPNPIGLSIVRLVRLEGNRLYLGNVDILDGTPLLDIKPYVPDFDQATDVRVGWLEAARGKIRSAKSDDRFS